MRCKMEEIQSSHVEGDQKLEKVQKVRAENAGIGCRRWVRIHIISLLLGGLCTTRCETMLSTPTQRHPYVQPLGALHRQSIGSERSSTPNQALIEALPVWGFTVQSILIPDATSVPVMALPAQYPQYCRSIPGKFSSN